MPLPRSAVLALWLNACLRGSVGPDDFAEVVRGEDPQHLVVDWLGSGEQLPLVSLPTAVLRASGTSAALALPVAGDLLGLRGPVAFNTAALDAGEAVVLNGTGLGLVPTLDARTVLWQRAPAEAALPLDGGEESRRLRQALVTTTAELTRLDVAAWQPEIPDLLLNARHRPPLPIPPGVPARQAEDLDRAALCLEVVDLALRDDGGTASAYESGERRRSLTELERAARRVIAAVCSDSLTGS